MEKLLCDYLKWIGVHVGVALQRRSSCNMAQNLAIKSLQEALWFLVT